MKKNKHRGSDLRDFLRKEGVLEEVETRAVKRALALRDSPRSRAGSPSPNLKWPPA